MWVNFIKLVLWLTTTLVVKEVVCVETCPEYIPYYCACSLKEMAEIKQLKMCYYDDLEKVGCHPCNEQLQNNVNCNSCPDDTCPICSLHNFGAGQPYGSQIKEQLFVKFVKRHGIFYTKQQQDYTGLETKENARFDISLNENGNINPIGSTNNFFSILLNSLQKMIDITEDTDRNYSNLQNGRKRTKWFKSPNQTNSAEKFKFVEDPNSKQLKQPIAKFFIPESTMSEDRRKHQKSYDPTNFAHTIEKSTRDNRRKLSGVQNQLNSMHYILPYDVPAPYENFANENFISPHISGGEFNVKTLTGDKCHFRSVPDDSSMESSFKTKLFKFHCSTINVSKFVPFDKYYSNVILIEREIQNCISDHSANILDIEKKFQLIKTSCNISLPLMVVLNSIKLAVESEKETLRHDKIVEVQNSSLIDKVEFITEISNLSIDKSRKLDKPVVHNKKIYNSIKGKLKIETKFLIKKSSVARNLNEIEGRKRILHLFPLENGILWKSVINFKNFNPMGNFEHVSSNDGQKAKIVFRNSPDFEINSNNSSKYLDLPKPFINILSGTTAFKEQINKLEHNKSPLILKRIGYNPFHLFPPTFERVLLFKIDTDMKGTDEAIKYSKNEMNRRNLFDDLSKNTANNEPIFYSYKTAGNVFPEILPNGINNNRQLGFHGLKGWHETRMKDAKNKFEIEIPNNKWIHKFTKITDGTNKLNSSDYETENNKRLENIVDNMHDTFNFFAKETKNLRDIYDDVTEINYRNKRLQEDVHHKQKKLRKQIERENENLSEETAKLTKFEKSLLSIKDHLPVEDIPDTKTLLTRKRRETSQFSVWSFLNDTEKFDKFVLSQLSVLKLFILNPNSTQKHSQKLSDALWFQYSKYVLIPNVNKTVQSKNLKDSDIYKMLNASITTLKESNIYYSKCKTCSVAYKILLDNGFKSDLELMEKGKSSVVVLMDKPRFFYHKYAPKLNKQKSKTPTKNDGPFIIQMNIDLLFLSSNEYDKLSRKNAQKSNLLQRTPWKNLKKKFVLKLPKSFSTKSELLNFSKSKNHEKPIYVELANKEPVVEELQNIVFAVLTKMHERKFRTTRTNHSNPISTISPMIKTGGIELKENKKSVDDLKKLDSILVDLKVPHLENNKDRVKNSEKIVPTKKDLKLSQRDEEQSFNEPKSHKHVTKGTVTVSIGNVEMKNYPISKVDSSTVGSLNRISTNHEPHKSILTNSSVNLLHDVRKDHFQEIGDAEPKLKFHEFVDKINGLNEHVNVVDKVNNHEKSSTFSLKEKLHANESHTINDDVVKKISFINELGDNSTQLKNSVVKNQIIKTDNLTSWKEPPKPTVTPGQKINELKHMELNTSSDVVKKAENSNTLQNTKTLNQQMLTSEDKNFKIDKIKNKLAEDSGKFETNFNHESKVLKGGDNNTFEKNHQNQSLGQDSNALKETSVVHEHKITFNETASLVKNEQQTIREDSEYHMNGILRLRRSLRDLNEDFESHGQDSPVFKGTPAFYRLKNISNETADSVRNEHGSIPEDTERYSDGVLRFRRSLLYSDEDSESDDFPIHFRLEDKDTLHRRKRSTGIPHNQWCPIHSMRRNGNVDCTIWTFKKACKLVCHPGYNYNGSQTVEMHCLRKGNNWKGNVNRACSETGDGDKPPKGKRRFRGWRRRNNLEKYQRNQNPYWK